MTPTPPTPRIRERDIRPSGSSEEQLRFLQSTRNSETETWRFTNSGALGGLTVESTVQPVGSNGKSTYVTVETNDFCGCTVSSVTMHGEIDEFGNSYEKGSGRDEKRWSRFVVRTVDVARQIIVYDTTGTTLDENGGVHPTFGTTTYDHRQQTKTWRRDGYALVIRLVMRKVGGASPVAAPSAADPMVRR